MSTRANTDDAALLTIPDAARLVRRPVGTVADWRRKGKGKAENAKRERIFFSPHCLTPSLGLFEGCDAEGGE